jgi:hypothetical protein
MNKLIPILLFTVLNPSLNAFASKEVGNGGDAVVCRGADRSIRKIELFDYYEARVMRQADLQLSDSPSTETAFAVLLQRMEKISKFRAKQYAEWGASFMKEARFLKGVELPDIPDSGPIPFPYGCKIEQLVIQKAPNLPGDRLYTINKELWDALSPSHRAGIIMHELIYREAIQKWRHEDSVLVRYFNSVLASPAQLEEVVKTDQSLVEFMKLVHFYEAEIHGIRIELVYYSPVFHSGGQLQGASVKYDGETLMVYGQPVTLKARTWVQFFPSGAVKEMTGLYFDPFTQKRFAGWICFYEDGHIQNGVLATDETIIEPHSGIKLKAKVDFDESGRITSGELAVTSVQTPHFEICGINRGGTVQFEKNAISRLKLSVIDPMCSWVEVGGGRTPFDIRYAYQQLDVRAGYIEAQLFTPKDLDAWVNIQDQRVKLAKSSSLALGEKGIPALCSFDDERGFIELKVGERRVAFKTQAFQTSSGEKITPELRIFRDSPDTYIWSGVLARDTLLPTAAGEKMFSADHYVYFDKEGKAQ